MPPTGKGPDVDVRACRIPGAHGELEARLYSCGRSSSSRTRLIVFFHGGAFASGDLDDAETFLSRLVRADPETMVLATTYTLAHVSPFPSAIEDAYGVLLWAKKNKTRLKWRGKQLFVAGIEAGANLAAVSTLLARDRNGPHLAGQILVMPMLDASLCSASMRDMPVHPVLAELAGLCADGYRAYLPNAVDRLHPYASPLASNRLRNLPPALILAAEIDPLRDEAEQYAAKLALYGVETTLRRIPSLPMVTPGDRYEAADNGNAQAEILSFIAALAD